jgi:hypothetical protein
LDLENSIVTAMAAAIIAIRRTKLEIAKETHAKASLVCPSVTVELIGGGGFKPSSQRNQNKSKVGHDFDSTARRPI